MWSSSVLFVIETTNNQINVTTECLNLFGRASGHKMSIKKYKRWHNRKTCYWFIRGDIIGKKERENTLY